MMKMQAHESSIRQKNLLVRSMVFFLAVMIGATIYAAFFKQDVTMAAAFAAVDAIFGWSYRAMTVHFFPSSKMLTEQNSTDRSTN